MRDKEKKLFYRIYPRLKDVLSGQTDFIFF